MATQFQNIEQEMKGLAAELATLRLPHKLNQYRVYERKLRSVEKQIKEVAESDDDNLQKRLEAELTQLQSTLDRAVLCGVSQCFICGGSAGNADLQLGSPKKFPITTVATYSRSVSAHANYANNQQRGKLPFENGNSSSNSSSSNRQYGTQISYHGKVGNNVAAEKGVSSPPPPPPPDIAPTLSSSPQPVTSSPSPSLSPSISLTPSPSPSPTPSSPTPTASPLPLPFEGNDEKEKETSNDTSVDAKTEVVVVVPVENGKSSNENVGKGTAVEVVLSTPEKTTTTTTTTTTTKISTPPASPKIARTASPSKPSTPPPPPPPPPPPLSPKPQRRSPSPSNFVKGLLKYHFFKTFC